MHHIVGDGWSFGALMAEIQHSYAALAHGRVPQLPPLAIQFNDYALWFAAQRATAVEEVAAKARQVAALLSGAPPLVTFPTDAPRPAVLPIQGAVNALLRDDLGGATFAVGTISFIVATLAMALAQVGAAALRDAAKPSFERLSSMPWWGWLGGFAGAAYVTTVFIAIPAIGAAVTVGLTVAGQQIVSIFVDRYGWFRLPQRNVSSMRVIGVALLLAGVGGIKLI